MNFPQSLENEAQEFAKELSGLLNQTITEDITLDVAMDSRGRATVGYRIRPANFRGEAIPLPFAYDNSLRLRFTQWLSHNDRGALTTVKSIYAFIHNDLPLLRYEFVRNTTSRHPESHLHLHLDTESAESFQALFSSSEGRKRFSSLHLPLGGRRFRPCIEDIIEFLIQEKLTKAHRGWKPVLRASREKYYETQLRAAVQSNLLVVADELRQSKWTVTPPDAAT